MGISYPDSRITLVTQLWQILIFLISFIPAIAALVNASTRKDLKHNRKAWIILLAISILIGPLSTLVGLVFDFSSDLFLLGLTLGTIMVIIYFLMEQRKKWAVALLITVAGLMFIGRFFVLRLLEYFNGYPLV